MMCATAVKPSTALAKEKYGWRRVKFGDVVECVNDTVTDPQVAGIERVVGLDHLDPGSLHITRWANIEAGTTFTRRFKSGQVLFGKRRAYQRKLAVAEFDGICSGDILVFEPKNDDLIPELLPFIIQCDSFWQHALNTSAGSLSPRTKWLDLARYDFALPPKEEQHRIAQILWAADDYAERLDDVRASTEIALQSSTESFLSSCNFPEKPCRDLLLENPHNGLSPKTGSRGLPTLSISSIRDGQVKCEGNLKYADIAESTAEPFFLQPRDVLVVRGNGNRNLVGRAGIVTTAPAQCFYPDLLIRLKFRDTDIRPEFANAQWNAASTHRQLIRKAKSTNGIWKVNGKDLAQHILKVPPLDAQDEFLAQCRTLVQAKEAADRNLESARSLKHGLIRHMLESRNGK